MELKQRWKNEQDLNWLLSLSYSNLGNVYGRQGLWEKSAKNFDEALALGGSLDTTLRQALTTHNYGCMRFAAQQIESAIDLLTRAFQIRSATLGDHYDTASTLHMLALCHYQQGELNDARYVHGVEDGLMKLNI